MWSAAVVVACVCANRPCVSYTGSAGGMGNRMRAMMCASAFAGTHNMSLALDASSNRHSLRHIVDVQALAVPVVFHTTGCHHLSEYRVFRVLPFDVPISLPLLPAVSRSANEWLQARNMSGDFACAHYRTFERGPAEHFNTAFVAFRARARRVLVIHDGYYVPRFNADVVVGPQNLHKHGVYNETGDLVNIVAALACSTASAVLVRRQSTFGNLIEGLAAPTTSVDHYD